MTDSNFVCIHLSLPKLERDPNLQWVPSFCVPVARIFPWSLHPYTLLRYIMMCFAATGAREELSLSSQYPVNPVTYNSPTLSDATPDLQVIFIMFKKISDLTHSLSVGPMVGALR
jgi:hypothetical protein